MSSNKPFFSIVMPTYNRATLLPFAIESVLQQSFTDFELIISNGGSTDNTKEVIGGFTDKRIRYFESEKRLNIGDNYQNALDQAKGEYITFLSDDDAFAPIMLERVKQVIDEQSAEVVAFRVSYYYHDRVFEHYRCIEPNTLYAYPFSGAVEKYDASEAIRLLFAHLGLDSASPDRKFIVPFLANAVYHRAVFSRIKKIRDKLFDVTPADMYLAIAVFFVIDTYFCLDEPLHVWSFWAGNATGSLSKKGDKLREHYEKLLNGRQLEFTPLKFALPLNCTINAILQAKYDFKEFSSNSDVDWLYYFTAIYKDLLLLKSLGVNTAREIQEFEQVLAQQPVELRQNVSSRISKTNLLAEQTMQFLRNNFPFAVRWLKILREQAQSEKSVFARGEDANFNNVLEAAQYLSYIIQSR
jgi:glycosyltransferase involved in cell wall biosynthesis